MSSSFDYKLGEVKCQKCGRTFSTSFTDCPFCDLKYDVVHGQ